MRRTSNARPYVITLPLGAYHVCKARIYSYVACALLALSASHSRTPCGVPPRSNLHSFACKQACRLSSFDYHVCKANISRRLCRLYTPPRFATPLRFVPRACSSRNENRLRWMRSWLYISPINREALFTVTPHPSFSLLLREKGDRLRWMRSCLYISPTNRETLFTVTPHPSFSLLLREKGDRLRWMRSWLESLQLTERHFLP